MFEQFLVCSVSIIVLVERVLGLLQFSTRTARTELPKDDCADRLKSHDQPSRLNMDIQSGHNAMA